jgi:N-acetyl-anhydromuramyl-L-alanine amidase AmpD
MALIIDFAGMIFDQRVRPMRFLNIERAPLRQVKGIVVHQTDAATAEATFHGYRKRGAMGAHFLIDKNGVTYQTASVRQITMHIGSIKARCLTELTCSAAAYRGVRVGPDTHRVEMRKAWPARYPTNAEAVGIELVGRASFPPGFAVPQGLSHGDLEKLRAEVGIYETPTTAQNMSLKWLVDELVDTLKMSRSEIFRHPVVSWKNPDEARRASW